MSRPKFATGHDDNHMIVRDYLRGVCGVYGGITHGPHTAYKAWLRGVPIIAVDTSRIGGVFLDWLVCVDGLIALVEVKTEAAFRADKFEPGERWTLLEFGPNATTVVVTDDDVAKLFDRLVK